MINDVAFRKWLDENTQYSNNVKRDYVCRMKRADKIKEWNGEETYLFYLEKEKIFKELNISVRSQLRKAVRLYQMYVIDESYLVDKSEC